MKPILEIQKVSKRFFLNHETVPYYSFRERLTSVFKRQAPKEEFWALRDVTFNVRPGESVGIIGRNGAGKSTLLKILSRITLPTKGKIICRGRVASLLEVGTGFHQELTGRENIFMNGSILGMRKAEIKSHFDEIVDFSGVEKFLDTPLKHFSSGMQLRLAFAVAAHLEPEILIIDEVLAVGDSVFQKKCMQKMEAVSMSGRTILFVSHNMVAVGNLCRSAFLLREGAVVATGETSGVISQYQGGAGSDFAQEWKFTSPTTTPAYVKHLKIKLTGKQPTQKLNVECIIKSQAHHKDAFLAFDVSSSVGITVLQAIPEQKPFIRFSESEQCVVTEIDLPPLIPGTYRLSCWMGSHYTETLFWEKEIVNFEITESPMIGRIYPHSFNNGFVVPASRVLV